MLDEFGSENKDDYIAGFPPHRHRGIETVTYMLNGEFEHQDSTGAKGIMTSGDVQWMKTGRGIIHSEMPAMKEGKLLGFQLWINMPAKYKKNTTTNAAGINFCVEKADKCGKDTNLKGTFQTLFSEMLYETQRNNGKLGTYLVGEVSGELFDIVVDKRGIELYKNFLYKEFLKVLKRQSII